MPYNTLYNVSVISIDPCGQNSVFEIYYGELNHINFKVLYLLPSYYYTVLVNCGNIVNQTDTSIQVHGNLYPTIEGISVTFSCPPGLVLTGPIISTCMRNGEWEPDPRYVKCLDD